MLQDVYLYKYRYHTLLIQVLVPHFTYTSIGTTLYLYKYRYHTLLIQVPIPHFTG